MQARRINKRGGWKYFINHNYYGTNQFLIFRSKKQKTQYKLFNRLNVWNHYSDSFILIKTISAFNLKKIGSVEIEKILNLYEISQDN